MSTTTLPADWDGPAVGDDIAVEESEPRQIWHRPADGQMSRSRGCAGGR